MKLFVKKYIYCLVSFLIIVVLVVSLLVFNKVFKDEAKDEYYNSGMNVLDELEEKEVTEVNDKINKNEDSNNENTSDNDSGEKNYKEYFKNDVFMGDSLVEAFNAYQFLDSSCVVAKVGGNLTTAEESIDKVIGLDPKNLFIAYGLNELLINDNKEDFINKYNSVVQSIKEKKPDINIYITSIFYVKEDTVSKNPVFRRERIDEYNEALKEMCNENKYNYVDINQYVTENYYEPDGIHLIGSFYYIWLDKLIEEVEKNN